MHVAPYEYRTACANPDICVKEGHYDENLDSTPFNTGLFALLLQRGDIKAICCGPTHKNDFDANIAASDCFGTPALAIDARV